MFYKSIDELVGKTPLMELCRIEDYYHLNCRIFAKLEYLNPAGSTKDRAALNMINDAEERGLLSHGSVIIEPTSGNTGIGLAAISAARGYKCIIVMPDSMSIERCKLMKAYGAQLVLTPGVDGMSGAIAKAEELHKELPGSFIAGQFDNPANAEAHYKSTGPEIYTDLDGKVDAFVAGIGTGGTITGTGKYLKSKLPDIKIIGMEPASSPYLTRGIAGTHGLQGLGAGFIPKVLDCNIYDEILTVTDEEAYCAGRLLARSEGILCGISSGAALHAAITLGARNEYNGKNIVVLLPDTGDRYLSTPMFDD